MKNINLGLNKKISYANPIAILPNKAQIIVLIPISKSGSILIFLIENNVPINAPTAINEL